jgi:hypothetical protein
MAAIRTLTTTADRATAMATSRHTRRKRGTAGATAVVLALAGLVLVAVAGSYSRARDTSRVERHAQVRVPADFSWLHPEPAPASWRQARIASGDATLAYPSDWTPIPGDLGTVTASLRDSGGIYRGYLNVTPRQGAERLTGWSAFRTGRNRAEDDKNVDELASAGGLSFRDAQGSCVIDDYLSRVGSHRYREVACIVAGRRGTSVFVGAALEREWPTLGPVIRRAASAFLER